MHPLYYGQTELSPASSCPGFAGCQWDNLGYKPAPKGLKVFFSTHIKDIGTGWQREVNAVDGENNVRQYIAGVAVHRVLQGGRQYIEKKMSKKSYH